jgi:hypothetical protein
MWPSAESSQGRIRSMPEDPVVAGPSIEEIDAAANVLREFWDHDGRFLAGDAVAYSHFAFGIADMFRMDAPFEFFPEYLGVLEEGLGYSASPYRDREAIAQRLIAAMQQARQPEDR